MASEGMSTSSRISSFRRGALKTLFECSICDKSFYDKATLNKHVKIHRGVRYHCKVCPKDFSQAVTLRTHMLTHSGEKPFECRFCERRFRDSANFRRHLRTHADEKPSGCLVRSDSSALNCGPHSGRRVNIVKNPFHVSERPTKFSEARDVKSIDECWTVDDSDDENQRDDFNSIEVDTTLGEEAYSSASDDDIEVTDFKLSVKGPCKLSYQYL